MAAPPQACTRLNYSRCATGGRPGASGDGLRMAIEAGAATKDITLGSHTFASSMGTYDVWPVHDHMGRYGEFDDALGLTDPAIYINTEDKRFAPESMGYSWAGKHIVEQPNLMAYYVFGSTQPDPELVAYENMILMQDDTLEGLAKSMNVPVDAFVAEVERYNGFVDAGEDADFGKYMNTATKIAVPPFYAIPVITQPYATYGGVMVDIDTHVIDTNGDPIPGLYAAGTVCGISSEQEGLFYCGGVNQGLFYGMVAGQNAANKTEGSHVDIDASTPAAAAASYRAGTYTGEGEGMHGTIEVTLTVGDDGAIASVDEITDPGETEGVGGHEAIADGTYAAQIMDAQSANIDGISGATVTSNGVKAAEEAALAQAA